MNGEIDRRKAALDAQFCGQRMNYAKIRIDQEKTASKAEVKPFKASRVHSTYKANDQGNQGHCFNRRTRIACGASRARCRTMRQGG